MGTHCFFVALHRLALHDGGAAQEAGFCIRLIIGIVAVQDGGGVPLHAR